MDYYQQTTIGKALNAALGKVLPTAGPGNGPLSEGDMDDLAYHVYQAFHKVTHRPRARAMA